MYPLGRKGSPKPKLEWFFFLLVLSVVGIQTLLLCMPATSSCPTCTGTSSSLSSLNKSTATGVKTPSSPSLKGLPLELGSNIHEHVHDVRIHEHEHVGEEPRYYAIGKMPSLSDTPIASEDLIADNNNNNHQQGKVQVPEAQPKLDKSVDQNLKSTIATSARIATIAASTVVSSTPPNMTVAYAVSFIKCGDFQTHSAGLTDASLVLRHSIHKISKRNPDSGSNYDYKMYAIVHRQAEECSKVLQQTGFEVMIVDPPLNDNEIQGDYLRSHIKKEWCCGNDEWIKLYAYTLPEEIIVHVDIDFAFYKPMDDLFDAMLFDKDSPEGKAARSRIQLERLGDKWPDKISAYITRDWPQVAPNKFPPAYQAGFLVARRDPSVLDELVNIIKVGNYSEGWGWNYGWGNKGYGGYVGAMAMQGVIAYYYDHIRPNTAVELNQCRYNHMGMDVLYRKQPNFRKKIPGVGGCRNGLAHCEDCMMTEMDKIYSVHYTMCRKPWQCQATGISGGKDQGGARATAINTDTVNLDHCLGLVRQWHELRSDFEKKLYELTKDESIQNGTIGEYKPEVFGGHCQGDGNSNYLVLSAEEETFRRIQELYI
jgi:hypothetical protein